MDKNIDLIAIDNEYSDEYKKALYNAQKTDNSDDLVVVFKKCQNRLNEKLSHYEKLLMQIDKEIDGLGNSNIEI